MLLDGPFVGSRWIAAGRACEKFVLPMIEELTQFGDDVAGDRDVAVVESCKRSDHCGKYRRIETGIDLCRESENDVDRVAPDKGEDVGEVAGFGAVEQCQQFATGEFLKAEVGPSNAGCRREIWRGVEGKIYEEVLVAGNEDPAECIAVANASDGPATVASRDLEGRAGCLDRSTARAVKMSRSRVGRLVRCCAANAAPPARRNPSLSGSEKNRSATATWNGVSAVGDGSTTRRWRSRRREEPMLAGHGEGG